MFVLTLPESSLPTLLLMMPPPRVYTALEVFSHTEDPPTLLFISD